MVHFGPRTSWRRRLDRLGGVAIVILGIVVAVAAVVALHQPKGHDAAVASGSGAAASTTPTTPTGSSASGTETTPGFGTEATTPGFGTASAPGSGSAATSTDALKTTPLVVLNNTTRSGLAQTAAKQFEAGGWTVRSTGNLSDDILSTCAYYDPAVANSMQAATALQQQFPAIKRVVPKFAGLPSGPIVVVLTTDYS